MVGRELVGVGGGGGGVAHLVGARGGLGGVVVGAVVAVDRRDLD